MAAERRILLLSRAPQVAPVLREVAAQHAFHVVRAADATAACERLAQGEFTCALVDLDTLGEHADEFLAQAQRLQPGLRTVGFGRMVASRPAAAWGGVPLLSKPLRREQLESALGAPAGATVRRAPAGPATGPRRTAASTEAARLLDATQEELQRRVSQLTTLYQIARAISESRNWSEALDYFLATLRDYLGVHGAAILLWSRETTVLAPRTVLAMRPEDVTRCVEALRAAYPVRGPVGEIHSLECYAADAGGLHCNGHSGRWHLTVLPLLYRRAPLGFLVLDKPYEGALGFGSEMFFLQTIQTVLGEEVANAVHLSRLVDLKNFNAAVLDNVESGVLTANEHGAITFANRLARQTLGLPPDEAPADLQFDALFGLYDGAEPVPVAGLLDGARETRALSGEMRRPDGQRVPVAVRTSRIRNPSDSETLLVVAFEDLSERRRLEEHARRSDRLRSLGELSAAIAHEIRNPLQGISLTLSNLKEHLQPGAETYVRVMFSEMERLNGIVGGILAFARPAPPAPVESSVFGVCQRALDLAADRAAQRQVRLEIAPIARGETGEWDEGQIVQVLLNLLLNAIDASPPGGRVEMRAEPAAQPIEPDAARHGTFWRIAVRDQGPGVPPPLRSKLFDPFFTTKSDGTGLGLAVSSKIVEEHRGAIHVDSPPEGGTTFIVELPRRFEGLSLEAHR